MASDNVNSGENRSGIPEHEYCRQRHINLDKLRQPFHAIPEADLLAKAIFRVKLKGVGPIGISQ